MLHWYAGFEYDIFISYRHKDNKGGHWVTEFVDALNLNSRRRLRKISPFTSMKIRTMGLLETHTVDKVFKEKLIGCLYPYYIANLLRPKSFAWKNEFLEFNKMAKEDEYGRDIKLANGNVASRIVPIKIHDLDADDKTLLENELGGVLRAIEFIFKSPGVNRPLRAREEHPQDNLNRTFYHDQVNKVANATKEIIAALKHPLPIASRTSTPRASAKPTSNTKRIVAAFSIFLLLVIGGFFLYPRMFPTSEADSVIDKSIAVLPFADISETRDQAYFSDGMMIEILDHLFKIKDLRIIPRNSTLGYKDSSKPIKEIASELGVAHLIQGSVRGIQAAG